MLQGGGNQEIARSHRNRLAVSIHLIEEQLNRFLEAVRAEREVAPVKRFLCPAWNRAFPSPCVGFFKRREKQLVNQTRAARLPMAVGTFMNAPK